MSLYNEYMKERRKLQIRNYYYKKKYGNPIYKIPTIPKRVTNASVRHLTKMLTKSATVKYFNKSIGLTSTGKIKKTTKNKVSKKPALDSLSKKPQKHPTKYLPKEENRIIENVTRFTYNLDDIENTLTNMYISSKRGNNTHRANVYDLYRMIKGALDNALFEEGYSAVAERLKNNAETVEEAIQTIEGYYKDSNEEQLKEAIDKVTELISIITGKDISQNTAKSLEDLFTGTMEHYEQGSMAIVKGEAYLPARRKYRDKQTGEILETMPHPVRFDVDTDTGIILDEIIL